MTILAGSAETLSATSGSVGTWFTATGGSFCADVDNASTVYLQTRRSSSDTAPKIVASERSGADVQPRISGPGSVMVSSVAGRQYRFVVVSAPAAGAIVAADA
jgi:hypothetical protein